ncbi:PPOX class F420-dependent enzyme [Catellatospora sp. IY07-71]|uniref:PPOX class F420-dependent oxidoreductase n=1 Tax=Catellatospora sp. IY07-71 TaxID=2728827 RepID=UPI001BB46024|nr:PPOX class F420-dependent oxidoreductase [Catellatospora sp. IY07-71]BCJ73844.1 PPOX class F420-dependent enzyme [Catellatospora sp. IY07-71]
MTVALSELAKRLIDADTFATLATVNPNGSPQSSVVWVTRDGDHVVFSTILGRRKTRNMQREPRVSLTLFDPANPYQYVEVRGEVTMTEQGGPELIQELSQRYTGKPFTEHSPDNVRVVCRLTPAKVFSR